MSYTSFSIMRPGRAWDGVKPGTEEWNALMEVQMSIIEEGQGTTIAGGWATGIGKFVNIITYPDIDSSKKVIARLWGEQLGEVESSGPFIPLDEWVPMATG